MGLATQWLENEVAKKEKELMELKEYRELVELKMALDYSKMLDERKERNGTSEHI